MHLVLLSIPGLRDRDIPRMANLKRLVFGGDRVPLVPSFPAVTCPVQCNMTTGRRPSEHGVVANGLFWRTDVSDSSSPLGRSISSQESDSLETGIPHGQVEMWTAWNHVVECPQLWDRMHSHDPALKVAAWFPMFAKGCGADYICTPAPIHNPDGSESLWCYTKPVSLYGELRDLLGHFPLVHFWGPMAGIQGTAWIVGSAIHTAQQYLPNFFYIYLPHLDYAAQKAGPDSPAAKTAFTELDDELGRLIEGLTSAYAPDKPRWLIASEYTIVPVDHVTYPNRILRDADLLSIRPDDMGREELDLANSRAWALVDHQHAHVFVRERDPAVVGRVVDLFRNQTGIAEILAGEDRSRYQVNHDRAGDVILISQPRSWQAYYWWFDDSVAPSYARAVDIHQKPGYDPVELFFDPATRGIPLDPTLVHGSHGAPAATRDQQGVFLSSDRDMIRDLSVHDTDVARIVLTQFGIG
ncbi:MAG: alkaline phosphatase family protein [Pirellulales bacterium]|nr:alkaline phosphatase family protein [Pirellulales bacterium]